VLIEGKQIGVAGTLLKTARLQSEWYEFVDDPDICLEQIKALGVRADLFTFLQRISERGLKYSYHCETEKTGVLHIESYENWLTKQINFKTRNKVRKAGKKGVKVQVADFDDRFLQGIKAIYDECPIRQGRPFKHYAKDLGTLKREHATFLEQSEFIGAYCSGELIGFAKVFYQAGWASFMQIIAKIAEREKAPTNALIAKAVERCAEKGIPLLQFGTWGREGTVQDFKLYNGFQCYEVPRYYVPLGSKGRWMLRLGLHRTLTERLPESLLNRILPLRARWYSFQLRGRMNSRDTSSPLTENRG
jgi:hypothetical protein